MTDKIIHGTRTMTLKVDVETAIATGNTHPMRYNVVGCKQLVKELLFSTDTPYERREELLEQYVHLSILEELKIERVPLEV